MKGTKKTLAIFNLFDYLDLVAHKHKEVIDREERNGCDEITFKYTSTEGEMTVTVGCYTDLDGSFDEHGFEIRPNTKCYYFSAETPTKKFGKQYNHSNSVPMLLKITKKYFPKPKTKKVK